FHVTGVQTCALPILQWKGYTGNLPIYQKHAAAAGHFNPKVDDDGVSRRVPMLLEFEDAYYEPLSLAMVRTYLARTTGKFPRVERSEEHTSELQSRDK